MGSVAVDIDQLRVRPGHPAGLGERATGASQGIDKRDGEEALEAGVEDLAKLQDVLAAQDRHAVLLVLQAMDAAGKDGIIKHVMRGLNPQGTRVTSFGVPSEEELDHDFLWRCVLALPRRGEIGIFNRSYYEEVLVVRVHPDILENERLPDDCLRDGLWKRRFGQIRNFEEHLVENGTTVVKVFLHLSREEQRRRFLARLDDPTKVWKFRLGDVRERERWDEYQAAYEDAITQTSTEHAPWYVVPADHKWFARLAVAQLLGQTVNRLPLAYPEVPKDEREGLERARAQLEAEG